MNDKCFCHITNADGEKYVVKDKEARESVDKVRNNISTLNNNISTLNNNFLDFVRRFNTIEDSSISKIPELINKQESNKQNITENRNNISENRNNISTLINDLSDIRGLITNIGTQLRFIDKPYELFVSPLNLELDEPITTNGINVQPVVGEAPNHDWEKIKMLRLLLRGEVLNPNGNTDIFEEYVTVPFRASSSTDFKTMGRHSLVSHYHAITHFQISSRCNGDATIEFKFKVSFYDAVGSGYSSFVRASIRSLQIIS